MKTYLYHRYFDVRVHRLTLREYKFIYQCSVIDGNMIYHTSIIQMNLMPILILIVST